MSFDEMLRGRWQTDSNYTKVLSGIRDQVEPNVWMQYSTKIKHPIESGDTDDLRAIPLRSQSLGRYDLSGSVLDYADFSNSELTQTWLQGAMLNDANFSNAKLVRTQLCPSYGKRVNFRHASILQATMMEGKLTDSIFDDVRIDSSNLSDADFSEGSFVRAQAQNCRFGNSLLVACNLSKASFVGCDFDRASFRDSHLVGTVLQACDMRATDFRGAIFDGAKISGGNFGIVEHGQSISKTKFDDTPAVRKLVAESQANGIELIEWHAPNPDGARPAKVTAGQLCTRDGFWSTPAKSTSRRFFKKGEVMPDLMSSYGETIWQWDSNQEPPRL